MSATKWKMFFDISCPNSWISFKLLNNGTIPKIANGIEFVPMSDVKLVLIETYELRMKRRRKRRHELDGTIAPIREITDYFSKKLQPTESYRMPDNWEHVYSTNLRLGTLLSALFLSSVKNYCPNQFLRTVEVVGERIWELQQPVHKGAHLFRCSRNAGVSLRDTEEIVSRLSHVDSRQLLHQNSLEAFQLGAVSTPFFASVDGSQTTTFSSFQDFKRFMLTS
ncbi:DSBA domain-containing protein [Trichostrongylus colubriformis]|uniref:DSBA domain-containing protein n=1 Tax=Trichostrongylus colubriformis TaxID=6319 RepID=A0AAN8EWJ2_TRICO